MPKFHLSRSEYFTYVTTIEAETLDDAIAKANDIWSDDGPDAFRCTINSLEPWSCD